MIGGTNFSFGQAALRHSYYFSRGHYIWGWASWRRAWDGYDFDIRQWPELRATRWIQDLFKDPQVIRYYTSKFDITHRHEIDTWDFQWVFHCWRRNQCEIMPGVNLVANIGYDRGVATHTTFRSKIEKVPLEMMSFPLSHPPEVMLDTEADRYNEVFRRMSLSHAVKISPQIYVMNADGQNVQRLTFQGSYNTHPSWSPRGDRIAFDASAGGGYNICTIRPDGADYRVLTDNLGRCELPSWSPDGRHLVFSGNSQGGPHIYMINAEGTQIKRLTFQNGGDTNPYWSPRIQD